MDHERPTDFFQTSDEEFVISHDVRFSSSWRIAYLDSLLVHGDALYMPWLRLDLCVAFVSDTFLEKKLLAQDACPNGAPFLIHVDPNGFAMALPRRF